MKVRVVIFIFLLIPLISFAQDEHALVNEMSIDTTAITKYNFDKNIQVFPTAFYTPETNFGFGAVGLAIFKVKQNKALATSFVSFSGSYTLNKQKSLLFKHEINISPKLLMQGQIGYFDYPDVYAGYGNNHELNNNEIYGATFTRFKLDVLRRSESAISYGMRYWFQHTSINDIKEGGDIATNNPLGKEGGTFSGLGAVLKYDTRDNAFLAKKGWNTLVSLIVADKIVGASFDDPLLLIDIRKYIPILKTHTLAIQYKNEFHFGTPAFNHTAILGGEYDLRGYRYGIFRDKNSFLLQTEFRSQQFLKHFTLTAFTAAGGVSSSSNALMQHPKFTYGIGLWLYPQTKKSLFVRFDYSRGVVNPVTQGVYVSMGSAF